MNDTDTVTALRHEVKRWRRSALFGWLTLAGLSLATCANTTRTDVLVARQTLRVGHEEGARVEVKNGVVTVHGADGSRSELTAKGVRAYDAGGSPVSD